MDRRKGFLCGHPLRAAVIRCQLIEAIEEVDQPGPQRDLLPLFLVWIPAAVECFVVVPHHGQQGLQPLMVSENLNTHHRVFFDQQQLLLR